MLLKYFTPLKSTSIFSEQEQAFIRDVHARYGMITEADVGPDIVLWDKLDRDTRNAYAREIVANTDN